MKDNELIFFFKEKSDNTLLLLESDFSKKFSIRLNPSIVEDIRVKCYGGESKLSTLASILMDGSSNLVVKPFDKSIISFIYEAIFNSNLSINVSISGDFLRLSFPKLTEERRMILVKHMKQLGEQYKVFIRNIRRDFNQKIKLLLKNESISKDDEHKLLSDIQKYTDLYIERIDIMILKKEKDLTKI